MNSEKQQLIALSPFTDVHILTWNPAERDIHDSVIEQYILDLKNGSTIIWSWNVGRHKNGFKTGNLVYLLRQGTDRRGIIASGVLIEDGVQKGRFDHDPTRESNFVRFELQSILSIDDRLDLKNYKILSFKESIGAHISLNQAERSKDLMQMHYSGCKALPT